MPGVSGQRGDNADSKGCGVTETLERTAPGEQRWACADGVKCGGGIECGGCPGGSLALSP